MPYKDTNVKAAKHKGYSREHYLKNREKIIAQTKVRKAAQRATWNAFKSTLKCAQCDENHPAVLDFHHIDPSQKDKEVSEFISCSQYGRAMEEVKKCIVLCANHHRLLHHNERKNPSLLSRG
jgi:hypothetical protein